MTPLLLVVQYLSLIAFHLTLFNAFQLNAPVVDAIGVSQVGVYVLPDQTTLHVFLQIAPEFVALGCVASKDFFVVHSLHDSRLAVRAASEVTELKLNQ